MAYVAVIHYCYLGGIHAKSRTGSIDSRIAATYNKDFVARTYRNFLTNNQACIIETHTTKEIYSLANTVGTHTLYGELFGLACASADEYGIETAFEEHVDINIRSYGHSSIDMHSELSDLFNLTGDHALGQTVFGYSEHEDAPGFRFHFEYFYIETTACELSGNGKAGRPAAYYSHASAVLLNQWLAAKAHIRVEIGYELFEAADVDVLPFFPEYAIALALPLMGAYAAAHGREIALCVDYAHGIADVSHRELVNPVGNIIAHGAAFLALGHFAMKASLGFGYCLGHGIGVLFQDMNEL